MLHTRATSATRSRPVAGVTIARAGSGGAVPVALRRARERLAKNIAVVAVAGRDCERPALHGLLRAIQSIVALLHRPDTTDRSDLVFRREFKTPMVARFAFGLRRRRCF